MHRITRSARKQAEKNNPKRNVTISSCSDEPAAPHLVSPMKRLSLDRRVKQPASKAIDLGSEANDSDNDASNQFTRLRTPPKQQATIVVAVQSENDVPIVSDTNLECSESEKKFDSDETTTLSDKSSKNYSLCNDASEKGQILADVLQDGIEDSAGSSNEDDILKTSADNADDFKRILENNAKRFFASKPILKKSNKKNNDESSSDEDEIVKTCRIPLEVIRAELRNADKSETDRIKKWNTELKTQFPRWLYMMSENFNILLHGYGSKWQLLTDFGKMLHDKEHGYSFFTMSGFDSSFRLKDALISLANELKLNVTTRASTVVSLSCDIVEKMQENDNMDVVLIVYNIDGPNLRLDECQIALCTLARCPNFHMIASIDHINASAMWNSKMMNQFNWIWFEVNTYRSYSREIFGGNESAILGLSKRSQTSSHTSSSLSSVWSSLTENARRVFRLLVENREATGPKSGPKSMQFWQLCRLARENFAASSEAALRQLMVEFDDHRLVVRKTAATDGTELIEVAIDEGILADFFKKIDNH